MSVRKVYSVLVDGIKVHSGSFASCRTVYDAFIAYRASVDSKIEVVVCFKP